MVAVRSATWGVIHSTRRSGLSICTAQYPFPPKAKGRPPWSGHDVPWGTGVSNAAGQLAELRRQDFTGIVYLEYEARTPMIEAEIARCAEFFHRAAAASNADLVAGRVVPPGFTTDAADVWKKRL